MEISEPGEQIIVVGGPLGLANTLSDGIVSAVRTNSEIRGKGIEHPDLKFVQITAPISPGSSGSPVVSLKGQVIGNAVAGYIYGQNLNFQYPLSIYKNS